MDKSTVSPFLTHGVYPIVMDNDDNDIMTG